MEKKKWRSAGIAKQDVAESIAIKLIQIFFLKRSYEDERL